MARLLRIDLELLAQVQHVGVDRARGRKAVVSPHLVEEVVPAHGLVRPRGQIAQDLGLQVGERVLLLAARQAEAVELDVEARPCVGRLPGVLRAARDRADAREELRHAERLAHVVVAADGEAGQAIGELSGEFEMRGETDRMEKATGTGALDLRDGQFRQLEFFQNIGAALGLREFGNMRLKEGHADFHLSGQKIIVEQLLLATNDLQMTSKGTIRLEKGDRKVALDAQLSVDEALVKQLPSLIGDSFVAAENNRRTIDFNITGTTDKPKTNLLDKLIGSKINVQFGDLISNLFGGEKKPEDDKKKKEEEERKKAEKKAEKERKKKEKEKDKSAAVREADATSSVQPAATLALP